ncbi:MAG: hypothetical protein HFH15_17870 [Ruminococcus sp.]|nr:hypothetical protein [Ruminococcus sp.]
MDREGISAVYNKSEKGGAIACEGKITG